MPKPMIKICGINDADIARNAAEAGAHFIGLVFHPLSPRNVSLAHAIEISKAVKKAGASPVAVFVNQTASAMQAICAAADIQIVQLHGRMARAHHHRLPNDYQRIYVLNVSEEGQLLADDGLRYLNPVRDMILIDHHEPGTGKMIPSHTFHYPLPFPWLLAGGLTASNVASMIHALQPHGVDVSSGVEIVQGLKDMSLIQLFITSARGSDEIQKYATK